MSSYSSPAAQGSAQGTGLYSVTIAAQAGSTNADGHATDSAGNLAVDFAWGQFPLQPNDERNGSVSNIGGSSQDHQWSATSQVASSSLAYGDVAVTVGNNPTRTVHMDNHVIAEAGYASYPAYTPSLGNYIVTAVSGDGTTVTFTSQNKFQPGDSVNVTGMPLSGFNYSGATVVTANATTFTVSDSTTGSYTGFWGGKAEYASAGSNDGAFVGGVDYVLVPNVVGAVLANAQKALNDAELVVTTASAYTPAVNHVALTSNVATVTTAAAHGYAVGDSVVIAGLTTTALNGTHVLTTGTTGSTLKWAQTHGDIAGASDSGTAKVAARANTVFSQSVAGGTASVSAGSAITITPYFAS